MAFEDGINRRQIVTGAMGVGVASALGVTIARAQSATPNATPATTTGGTTASGETPQKLYTDFIGKLATNLGNLDTAKVDTAFRTSLKQMVDEAQQAGLISADEATTLKGQIDNGNFPGDLVGDLRGRFGGPGGMLGGKGRRQGKTGGMNGRELELLAGLDLNGLAQFMGISRADLLTELRQGKSLAEIAQAHGKSRADLKTYLVSQATDEIDKVIDAKRGGTNKKSTTPSNNSATPAATPTTT